MPSGDTQGRLSRGSCSVLPDCDLQHLATYRLVDSKLRDALTAYTWHHSICQNCSNTTDQDDKDCGLKMVYFWHCIANLCPIPMGYASSDNPLSRFGLFEGIPAKVHRWQREIATAKQAFVSAKEAQNLVKLAISTCSRCSVRAGLWDAVTDAQEEWNREASELERKRAAAIARPQPKPSELSSSGSTAQTSILSRSEGPPSSTFLNSTMRPDGTPASQQIGSFSEWKESLSKARSTAPSNFSNQGGPLSAAPDSVPASFVSFQNPL
jgi:hypothetical protein